MPRVPIKLEIVFSSQIYKNWNAPFRYRQSFGEQLEIGTFLKFFTFPKHRNTNSKRVPISNRETVITHTHTHTKICHDICINLREKKGGGEGINTKPIGLNYLLESSSLLHRFSCSSSSSCSFSSNSRISLAISSSYTESSIGPVTFPLPMNENRWFYEIATVNKRFMKKKKTKLFVQTRKPSFVFSWMPCSIKWSSCVSRSLSFAVEPPWAAIKSFSCFSKFLNCILTRCDSANISLFDKSWRFWINTCGGPAKMKEKKSYYAKACEINIFTVDDVTVTEIGTGRRNQMS